MSLEGIVEGSLLAKDYQNPLPLTTDKGSVMELIKSLPGSTKLNPATHPLQEFRGK